MPIPNIQKTFLEILAILSSAMHTTTRTWCCECCLPISTIQHEKTTPENDVVSINARRWRIIWAPNSPKCARTKSTFLYQYMVQPYRRATHYTPKLISVYSHKLWWFDNSIDEKNLKFKNHRVMFKKICLCNAISKLWRGLFQWQKVVLSSMFYMLITLTGSGCGVIFN